MKRLAVLLVALATAVLLVGCQTPSAPSAQATTSTTATTVTTPPTTVTTTPPTTRAKGVRGDGVCDELEQGSNSPDCDQPTTRQEVPADWVPCGQTGAWCPPGYDTPELAYDPAPGRRWTYLDELAFERRLRAVLEGLAARSSWPRTRFGTYDHSWPSDPGPGSASRPIQPYPAFGSDPNDADGDGVACEYGCKN